MIMKTKIPRSHSLMIAIICWVIAGIALCCMDCSGGRKLTKQDYIAGSTFTVVKIGDTLTTMKGLDEGLTEKNPLFGEHPSDSTLVLTSLIAIGGMWFALKYIDNPKVARAMVYICSALTGIVVFHNLQLIKGIK